MNTREPDQLNKPYHHGNLRRALMSAALEQLAQGEEAPLNFSLLAKAVGVSHSAVYRHFPEKQALMDALAQHGFEELIARFGRVSAQPEDSTAQQLVRLGRAYVQFALDEPVLIRLMFSGASSERQRQPSLKQASLASLAPLRALVQQAHAAGELLTGDEQTVVLFYWTGLYGLAELLSQGQLDGLLRGADSVSDLIDACLEAMIRGTLKPS